MKVDAWHLPWGRETVSHGILDINRGCNITCRACYNSLPPAFKSMDVIKAEYRELKARRKLGYVSLVGGETLLHPRLGEIISYLKNEGLCVQLFTNGLLLNARRLVALSQTGLDIIYAHIDGAQTRPDLPPNPGAEQLRKLWDEKADLIARHGIDVGLAMTAYADRLSDVRDMVEYVVDSPHVNYLLVTLFRDTQKLSGLRGNIDQGLRGTCSEAEHSRTDTLTNWRIMEQMHNEMKLRPFAYLGSNKDRNDPRWLSYLVATRRKQTDHGGGRVIRYAPRASAFEKVYCALSLRLAGHYPMYQRQSAFQLVAQLILNSLMGGDFVGNFGFLARAGRAGGRFGAKRLLFQNPAQIEEDGTLTHCLNCPDAVAKNGELVPLCISDRVEQLVNASAPNAS